MKAGREQQQCVQWIWAQPGAEPPPQLRAVGLLPLAQGLAAYREHAKALAARALAAAYPLLGQWLGEAEFAGMAWAFARSNPPRQGDMNRFGGDLAEFLAGLPGMDPEPPALARLDWHLHQLAWTADDPPVDTQLWNLLQAQDADRLQLQLSPTLAVFAAPEATRELLLAGAQAQWGDAPTHAIAWRRGWRPAWAMADAGVATLLLGLCAGRSLAVAIEQALAQSPALDLALFFQLAAQENWLLGCAIPIER